MEAGLSNFKFLVSEDGKNVYALEFESEKNPFEKWLNNEIKEAERFQREHPDNPNKFVK